MKKRVLVLGASGMMGHMLSLYLSELDKYSLVLLSRTNFPVFNSLPNSQYINGVDLESFEGLDFILKLIASNDFHHVINCTGLLIKDCADNFVRGMYMNTWVPHKLAEACSKVDSKLIHLSTDCVFHGNAELGYTEEAVPDETSAYGYSKRGGEITNLPHVTTLRMSIIGPEIISNGTGLFHWFMTQTDTVNGFSDVFWNGLTTLELAKGIDHLMGHSLRGLVHFVPPYNISKYDLLKFLAVEFNQDIPIVNVSGNPKNKTLLSTRNDIYFQFSENYVSMLAELHAFMEKHSMFYEECWVPY